MEHKHSVYDTDTHFVIAKDTREIKLESDTAPVIVQHDHNSERLSFELPRYIDGHDMTLCNQVQVHYLNVDSSTKDTATGVYDVEDLEVLETDRNTAVCSWLISENATKYAGSLNFMIRFSCIADDGSVSYRWNTGIYANLTVVGAYDNGEAVTEAFPDILAQWKAELFGIGDTEEQRIKDASTAEQAAITAKGEAVNASIPADYSALSALADHNRRNKAGAIVLEAQGESILLNDASEYPVTGLKVFGKSEQSKTNGNQLFDAERLETFAAGSATITNNADGSFTIAGSGNLTDLCGTAKIYTHEETLALIKKAGTIHFNNNELSVPYLYVAFWRGGNAIAEVTNRYNKETSAVITDEMLSDETFTMRIGFYGFAGDAITPVTVKPMLYMDGDGTWEPFTGGIASPSPEYPQEINSVENAVVTVSNRNRFGGSALADKLVAVMNAVKDEAAGTVMFYCVNASKKVIFDNFKPDTVYTFILKGWNSYGDGTNLYIRYTDGTFDYLNFPAEKTVSTMVFKTKQGKSVQDFCGITYAESTYLYYDECGIFEGDVSADSFEPYYVQTVTIPHTLPGIPVSSGGNYTDATGQQWICDEADLERGVYVQRVEQITGAQMLAKTPTLNAINGDYAQFVMTGLIAGTTATRGEKALCTHAPITDDIAAAQKFGVWIYRGDAVVFVIETATAGTVEEFKTWLADHSDMVLQYILATPIETALTDAEITAYKALCTNKPNTTILNDAGAYMAVEYVADTKTYIDNKIAELMAQ